MQVSKVLIFAALTIVNAHVPCFKVKATYQSSECCADAQKSVSTLCETGTPHPRSKVMWIQPWKRANGVTEVVRSGFEQMLTNNAQSTPGYLSAGSMKPIGCGELCTSRELVSEFASAQHFLEYLQGLLGVAQSDPELTKSLFNAQVPDKTKSLTLTVPEGTMPVVEAAYNAYILKLNTMLEEWGYESRFGKTVFREWSSTGFDKTCH